MVAVAGTILFAGDGALGELHHVVIVHLGGKAKGEAVPWLLNAVDVPGFIRRFPPDPFPAQQAEGAMRHRDVA